MKKLAIITTHPIQYYAPLFKLLSERSIISIKIFYTWGKNAMEKYDPGFIKQVAWDIPLLEGYEYEWAENIAANPGSHHFMGIITPGLIKQIDNYGCDAIMVIGWAYHSHLKIIRYFKNKVPIYFRGDSNLIDKQKGIKAFLKSLFLKWVYRHIDQAFYTGINNKAYFKECGLKTNQLTFAPHAIDNGRFALPRPAEADHLRDILGINVDDILILFAGKFEEKKSPELLLSAFLALNLQQCHLLLVGNGETEQRLKLQAAKSKTVHFMDFCNQTYMPAIYQACDLFCLPSKGPAETWGLAVNEAMACSKAVLVSDKCGCAVDLVSDTNGMIFKSGSIKDLNLSLKKLTANKLTLLRLGQQSALIIQDWNFENISEAIENKLLNKDKRLVNG